MANNDKEKGVRQAKQPQTLPPGVKLLRRLDGHARTVTSVAFDPSGETLASGSADHTVKLWDSRSGVLLRTFEGHQAPISGVAFGPQGEPLASGGEDGTVRLWDAPSGNLLQSFDAHAPVSSVAIDPRGTVVAAGSHDGTLKLWHVLTRLLLRTIAGHDQRISQVAFDPRGDILATASKDMTVKLWSVPLGAWLRTLEGHTDTVRTLAFDRGGGTLASGGDDHTVKLWDVQSGKLLRTLEGSLSIDSIAFSPDAALLASKGGDQTIRLWSCGTWETVAVIPQGNREKQWPSSLAFHPTRSLLAAPSSETTGGPILLWELDEEVLLRQTSRQAAASRGVSQVTAKVVLVGDHGVGKSALSHRLIHGHFREQAATHGQQFSVLPELGKRRADGTECEAILWDFAGQPDYRLVHSLFVDNADLGLVLYDASNLHDPLRGVGFWLNQLQAAESRCPIILVGARNDRGSASLTQEELDAFCRKHGIVGAIPTSAATGKGIDELVELMKSLIPWDEKPALVTTVTFKRIKDYILRLKQAHSESRSIVTPRELRAGLEATDANWRFTDAELMVAVGHLENYGYTKRLKTSKGELRILLQPERLNNLASSLVLEARRNPKGLGALEEKRLLSGGYALPELKDLPDGERDVLLDAAVLLFLEHNICFRETDPLRGESYLVFPELINLKQPPELDAATEEGAAYTVSGPTENVFAWLVAVLGYTHTFTRTAQWHNNARYEVGHGLVCGFRQDVEREGELELVLCFAPEVGAPIRTLFQGLFESFLARRNLTVLRYEPVQCRNGHLLNRLLVRHAIQKGETTRFCPDCGEKIELPKAAEPIQLTRAQKAEIHWQRRAAEQRTKFEQAVFRLNAYAAEQKIASPECYISYAWGVAEHERWVEKRLAADLQKAGIRVVLDRWHNAIGAGSTRFIEHIGKADRIVIVGTPLYRSKFDEPADVVMRAEFDLITRRLYGVERQKRSVIPLLLEGTVSTSLPPLLHDRVHGDFRDEHSYFATAFDLILSLYEIPPNHAAVADLRESLQDALRERVPERPDTLRFLHRILENAGNDAELLQRESAVTQLARDWAEHPDTLPTLHELARGDHDPGVRRAALTHLAVGWPADPQTVEILDERAQRDSDEDVRQTALHELARGWRLQRIDRGGKEQRVSSLRYRRETLTLLDRAAMSDASPAVRGFSFKEATTIRALRREMWIDWLNGKSDENSFDDLPSADPGFPLLRVLALRLKDIGPFVDSGEIWLTTTDGTTEARRTALIVGENSAGKSTILRCIALGFLGPDLALLADGNPERYVRQGSETGVGTIDVLFELQLDDRGGDAKDAAFCVGIQVRANQRTFQVQDDPIQSFARHDSTQIPNAAARLNWIRQRKYDRFGFACAYGALRNLTKQSDSQSDMPDDLLIRVVSLFRSSTSLLDPDLLDRLMRGASVKLSGGHEVQLTPETRTRIGQWLADLLPALQASEGFQESSIAVHDVPVALTDLSDGYASVLAFAGHLLYHASLASGNWQRDPAEISGLLLIDEIDLHLHPSWQRSVLAELQRLLPRMQIIATSHSPFVAGSIDSGSVMVLKRDSEGIHVLTDLPSIEGWRADQIATSELFGLATTRSIATETLHKTYAELLSDRGPDDPLVQDYGRRLASLLGYLGEGRVDRLTNRMLDEFIAQRFMNLDDETKKLVLASAGLKLAD